MNNGTLDHRLCRITAVRVGCVLTCLLTACRESAAPRQAMPRDENSAAAVTPDASITFSRDVAPIVFENCAGCHRPGESAPFSLLSYQNVRTHAEQIVAVTGSRFMPPWPPEPGHGDFAGQRRLGDQQISTIREWVEQGAAEGDPSDLPPRPTWAEGWQLGTPDLVLSMPEPYALAPDGVDVYRNFVIGTGLTEMRWVKSIQIWPGNNRVAHHALLLVDRTGESRRVDRQSPEPGFDGMELGSAQTPGPHFLSWQPGRLPQEGQDDMAWRLDPGTDLVLQIHMQPSGKPESVQAQIGLYFTEKPPPAYLYKICLRSLEIDIPPGTPDYEFIQKFTLPVDAEILAVLPHAHYVGKRLEGYASSPDGTRTPLILIRDWDFNWQSDYRYRPPVVLPRGSVITQRFTYDNSSQNIRNPHDPPRQVVYGPQSTDEMGELWLQLRLRSQADLAKLAAAYGRYTLANVIARSRNVLLENPDDAAANFELGKALLMRGNLAGAVECLRHAARLNPADPDVLCHLGLALLRDQKADEAHDQFHQALSADQDHFAAHHGLGLLHLGEGNLEEANIHFQRAVHISPFDPVALANLARVMLRQGDADEAVVLLNRSLEIRSDHPQTVLLLNTARNLVERKSN